MDLITSRSKGPQVLQYGTRVVVVNADGAIAADMTWEGATELGKALMAVARLAEEWAKAEKVAQDNALLLRKGIPLGLANHPAIQKESAKIAQWDRELRRAIPGGVQAKEIVGTPTIIRE